MTWGERAGAAGFAVFGLAVTALGISTLAGSLTFAGWGEGTLVSRIVCGGLYSVFGLGGTAAAVARLRDGRIAVEPAPSLADPAADPFNLSAHEPPGPGGGRGRGSGVDEY